MAQISIVRSQIHHLFLCSDSHCIFIYHFSTLIPGTGGRLQGPVTTIVKHSSAPMRDIYSVSKLSSDFSSLHHFYTHTHTSCRLPALWKTQLGLETDAGKLFFLQGVCAIHGFFGRERKNGMKNLGFFQLPWILNNNNKSLPGKTSIHMQIWN